MRGGTVSTALHHTAQVHPANTLFYDGPSRRSLSYAECWESVRHHRNWLTSQIVRQIAVSATAKQTRHRQLIGPEHAVVEVIVAYLATNSADYLLSVLACTDTVEHLSSLFNNNSCVRVRPALLNYRWTDGEIFRALRVQEPKSAASGSTKHITIILCGHGFEQVARKVVGIIETDAAQIARCHFAVSIRLPNFVDDCAQDESYKESAPLHHAHISSEDKGRSCSGSGADDALILFTSGTSSSFGAKGVRLSHNSLTVQAMAKLCPPCSYDAQTNMVASTVPFFHVGGISSALAVVMAGGTLTFPAAKSGCRDNSSPTTPTPQRCSTSTRFEPDWILAALNNGDTSANTLVVVPAMVHSLLVAAREGSCRSSATFRNVRLLLVGGQSLSESQLAQTRIVLPNARVVQTYACTEAGSSITFAQLHPPCEQYSSRTAANTCSAFRPHGDYVGFAPAHIELKIFSGKTEVGAKSLSEAAMSQRNIGIIATRGPHIMNGYWQRGNEALPHDGNRVGLTSDGWLMTNDRGYLVTEGGLYFSGRASDVIRSGGESIPASEVEKAIVFHPLVDTCAVFALPDERFGEAVCVALVLKGRHGAAPTKDTSAPVDLLTDIKRHCSENGLAPYKRPRRVFLLPELPTNSSGKVLKHKLVEMVREAREEKEAPLVDLPAVRSRL